MFNNLELSVLPHRERLNYLWLSYYFFGNWSYNEADFGIRWFEDGELTLFDLPLLIESVPGAVQLLVPRQPAP